MHHRRQATRTMASGGSKKKNEAMKRQRKNRNQHDGEQSKSFDKGPTGSSFHDRSDDVPETALITPTRTIIEPTSASMPPTSRFDSTTPSIPTRLELDWSSSTTSSDSVLDWKSVYPSIQPSVHGSNKNIFPDSKLDFTPPTPEGIMSDDVTSSLLDLKDLYDPKIHLPYAPQGDWSGYEPATPLSDELMAQIGVIGKPITTAEYMRQALTHPLHGYYTSPPKSLLSKALQKQDDDFDKDDIFDDWDDNDSNDSKSQSTLIGTKGDFVTAPEISHVFGHCICLWFMTQWQTLKKPSHIQLVELGPGRGTLMSDILQLAFTENLRPTFGQSIHTVHLIEASYDLRREQQLKLRETLGKTIRFEFDESGLVAPSSSTDPITHEQESNKGPDADDKPTVQVKWHYDFGSFRREMKNGGEESDMPVFMVLQEFLDALPVHAFEQTDDGWRERLIDVVSAEDDPPNPGNTPLVPRLRQVLAPDVTPAVELFFQNSNSTVAHNAPVGTVFEVCPEATLLVQDMAQVIEERGGVALMIDYGQEGSGDTLRAFSNHTQVPLTSYPGQVDVTADVDFFALKNCLVKRQERLSQFGNKNDSDEIISAFGPVTQGEFLMRMGASDMVIALIEQDSTTTEQANKFAEALKFLVFPEHMGEKFKVMAIGRKRDGIFAPPGLET